MKTVRIKNTFFETDPFGTPQATFEAGKCYPLNGASQRQIDLGNGELVETSEPAADAAEPTKASKKPRT